MNLETIDMYANMFFQFQLSLYILIFVTVFGFETRWGDILNLPNPSGRTVPWGSLVRCTVEAEWFSNYDDTDIH
jgi:hypothetical protein